MGFRYDRMVFLYSHHFLRIFSVFLGIWKANGEVDIIETIYFVGLRIAKIWFEHCFPQNSGSFQLSQDGRMLMILLELLCYDRPTRNFAQIWATNSF